MDIQIKRIYEQRSKDDGIRILVDGLWPRGLTKDDASIDIWLKKIAPSTLLRRWFGHDPARWDEFVVLYHEELQRKPAQLAILKQEIRKGRVTLLFAARDTAHNQAVALKEYVEAEHNRNKATDKQN